jgi:preprotein translocase subunit SecA
LEQLRQVIGLRSYGQKDPLVEYRKEAFSLFENLLEKIKFDVLTILYNLTIVENTIDNQKKKEALQKIVNNPDCLLLIHKNKKISRNEKCLVTGKKFKHCCGAL